MPEDLREQVPERLPGGRWNTPADQVNAVLYPDSERSSSETGTAVENDGSGKLV